MVCTTYFYFNCFCTATSSTATITTTTITTTAMQFTAALTTQTQMTTTMVAIATPTQMATPTISREILPTPTFIFPIANPHFLQIKNFLSKLTINCTVMVEDDSQFQMTTLWSYNGTSLSSNEKYKVANDHLTIREFTPEDVGVYRCTVLHQSGWNSSRQYFISTKQGKIHKRIVKTY